MLSIGARLQDVAGNSRPALDNAQRRRIFRGGALPDSTSWCATRAHADAVFFLDVRAGDRAHVQIGGHALRIERRDVAVGAACCREPISFFFAAEPREAGELAARCGVSRITFWRNPAAIRRCSLAVSFGRVAAGFDSIVLDHFAVARRAVAGAH